MAYRIEAGKSPTNQVRHVIAERLERAVQSLARGDAEGVHEARKRLKETRALLRLVRRPLGKALFAEQNAALRDAGRLLSGQRDAQALCECWQALAAQTPERFASADFLAVAQRLASRAETAGASANHRTLIARLQQSAAQLDRWTRAEHGFEPFQRGLRASYAQGRRALKTARELADDETLHEWRKRVKDHWYHTRLLQDAWPEVLQLRESQLKTLAEALGDDHDLAVLQSLIDAQPELFDPPALRQELIALVARRRGDLLAQALELGARLYAEKPGSLARSWASFWAIAERPNR